MRDPGWRSQRAPLARNEQTSARLAIQPMHQFEFFVGSQSTQCLDDAEAHAAPAMDRDASRLVENEQTFVRMSHFAIIGATLAVIVICASLASALQLQLVGRPLVRLRDKARRAGAGDFSRPLVLSQHDEMGELAAEINQGGVVESGRSTPERPTKDGSA